jgi:microcystin degradation protein MlrC
MSRTLFTACLGTETNTFSPIPTGPELFRRTMLTRGGAHGDRPGIFALPLIAWRERARSLGWRVVEGIAAFATPAGNTTRAAFESLRDEILGELRGALPVDAVLLNLHGAMIADGYPDAEGDLIGRVREIVGPDSFIGVELDLHCHLTRQKVAAASAIVIYKEYPHVDVTDRAQELFTLAERALAGEVRPVMAMHDCRMLGIFPTTREPLRGFVDRMTALEGREGILSVSLGHGFPWGDTPEVGMRTLVVADGDAAKAAALAERLGQEIWSLREKITPPFLTIDEAVTRVDGHGAGKPLVLADTADNPGIGAGGDSTFLVRRFIERHVGGIAVSPLWDPIATDIAFEAGPGAVLDVRIGGKLGPASGTPLDLRVVVKALVRDARQFLGSASSPLGRIAWLRAGPADDDQALDIFVNDYRTQSFSPECFTAAGLVPSTKRALVVKSTQHFHNGFSPIAEEILYVSAPGTGAMDMRGLGYRNVSRPLWPRVENPHP